MKKRLFNRSRIELFYMLGTLIAACWLVISAVNSYVSEAYQKAYLSLSQNVTHNLEEIYVFEYSDNSTYDQFSNELVSIELLSDKLYENIRQNHNAYFPILNPVPETAVASAKTVRDAMLSFTQRLERLLSAKVSLEYSNKTIQALKDKLWSDYSLDETDKLSIYRYLDAKNNLSDLSNTLRDNTSVVTLDNYVRLNKRVNQEISNEKKALIDSEVHSLLNQTNDFWLQRSSDTKLQIALSSVTLFLCLGAYLYWRQWLQQHVEAKLNKELLDNEKERSQLAMVVEHASDAIVITNRDGLTTWVNSAFEKLSGYQLTETIGKKPGDLLQGIDTSKEEIKRISDELSQGHTVQSELLNYHKDGRPYWIDIVITPIRNIHNQIEQFIAVERDSSDRKQLEQNLQQAVQVADASNRAKSTFLATMSHELRTPLNGILGMAQILESSVTQAQHKEQLSVLLESGNHLLSLLNDILDISKIEEGKLELEDIDFAIDELCSPIISTYSAICNEKGIQFKLNNQLPSGKSFRGDKSRIRQLIFNLLGNAVKFTERGSVELVFSNSQSSMSKSKEQLNIDVIDTGVGIPSDRLATIFDPFTQAEASTTRQFGGTGLGLAIVKKLSNLMGGDAYVSSELGKGSKFTVTANLTPIENKEIQLKDKVSLDEQAIAQSLAILLVEDNKVNALVAKTFCMKQGHNVEVAENGKIAVEKVGKKQYDLIIMDNHMPVMDGIEATRIIRQELGSKTVIFGCTADVFKEAHDNFVDAGANHILTKPLQKESFIDALQRYQHLLVNPTPPENSNVIQLVRHDIMQLDCTNTEAELTLLDSTSESKQVRLDNIEQFKSIGEETLNTLVKVYSSQDVIGLKNVIITLRKVAQESELNRLINKIDVLLSELDNDTVPNIEAMQSLVNLVEVNIHEAIRILDHQQGMRPPISTISPN
ncbi:ATP-binding protein [Vibrio sp. CyArs1]|uniref:ATP-binding protein n=1 Tax=Vibrio sp. CyArs1 TaxID=2682577 RepID=UPI001F06B824|nr:ATP-binding protein [Vibrio sp. CyArs1]